MKISYLITCKNEVKTLGNLLVAIALNQGTDELVVLQDTLGEDETENEKYFHKEVRKIVDFYVKGSPNCKFFEHPLDKNFGAHKNFGISKCTGDYIFQLDGDELPPEALLGENLHELLNANPQVEAYAVPRVNDFKGVTETHAKQWGWRLTPSPMCNGRPVVNFPDYQWRIFKRDYPRISFTRRLHEKIEGYGASTPLPAEEEYSLYHDKTIEKQVETNQRYNKMFTQDENKGHSVFK